MIVLDTNVLSALMRRMPDLPVLEWLNDQGSSTVWTTAVTIYELQRGLDLMPAGSKRTELAERMEQVLQTVLNGRVLPVDHAAARASGRLWARCLARGEPVSVEDNLISGIVLTHRATLATRNIRHFRDIPVVNPWTD